VSARAVLQAALVEALREADGLAALTKVFDAAPARAALPYAVVDDPVLIDWSTKDWAGREARFAVVLHDAGERPVRLRALVAAVEEAVTGMAADLGEGWRLVGVVLGRERVARGSGERWLAMSEFVARMRREG